MQPYFLAHPATCSGEKTASELINSGPCYLTSLIINTDGVNDATVIVYDAASAAGKIVRRFKINGDENYGGNVIKYPVKMDNGIYVALSGTGGSFIADYLIPRF